MYLGQWSDKTWTDPYFSDTCRIEGCQECIENTDDPTSRHCSMHTCSWRGCSKESRISSQFCSDHVCRQRGCERSRLEDSELCESHSCRHRGCPNVARRPGGCCTDHGRERDDHSDGYEGSDSDSPHRRRRHRHDQPRHDDYRRGPRLVSPGHRQPRRREEDQDEDDGYYTLSGRNSRNVSPGHRQARRRDAFEPRWDGYQANAPRRFRYPRDAEEIGDAFERFDRHARGRNYRWF